MARLSVNLNKIALLRNSRRTGVPDLLRFVHIALESGAQGITLHPRADERHIRGGDVPAIAAVMTDRRPRMELNIEGYPDKRLLGIVRDVRAEQCTLVPDSPDAFTSEKGWDLGPQQMQVARPVIAALKELGARVILFVDPDPSILDRVTQSGADGIEIYTGSYAHAFRSGGHTDLLNACARTATDAQARHLVVNAGHDLNLHNIPPLIQRIPFLSEASIGHELTADALESGFAATVRAYADALQG